MPKVLLESDFLTVDLDSFYRKKDVQSNAMENGDTTKASIDEEVKVNLLKLTSNDTVLVNKLLSLGDLFQRACKSLGYNIKPERGSNPLLAFLLQDYVKNNLLESLNSSNFKALYKSLANKLIATSEFFNAASNNYNIIYCKALYSLPPVDIEKYIKMQSVILKRNSTVYSASLRELNKKVFIYIPSVQEKDITKRAKTVLSKDIKAINTNAADAKLNSLKLAEAIIKAYSNYDDQREVIAVSNEKQNEVINNLNTPADMFVALLTLSLKSGSKKATAALSHEAFSRIRNNQIAEVTSRVASILPKGQIQADSADELVDKILAKLSV